MRKSNSAEATAMRTRRLAPHHRARAGHTSASVGRKYGNGVSLDVLAEAMGKVSYKGLYLSHLHFD